MHVSAITSQNGTAPKLFKVLVRLLLCAITSQNGTAPKPEISNEVQTLGAITSQNGTAPKPTHAGCCSHKVRLPVRTALLQNVLPSLLALMQCDYQSERHCSKTCGWYCWVCSGCDYQSERHCSKTTLSRVTYQMLCDYQSERHCSKTEVGSAGDAR